MKAWYLLYCKPRSEVRAQQNLTLQELETYLPMVRSEKKEKNKTVVRKQPLFPNYIFIKFDPEQTSVRQLRSTRGVADLVNCREKLLPIDEQLIIQLKQRELATPLITEKPLQSGDKIQFTEGPFADFDGIFAEKCGDTRCKVLFTFLGQHKSITVEQSVIRAVCA